MPVQQYGEEASVVYSAAIGLFSISLGNTYLCCQCISTAERLSLFMLQPLGFVEIL